MAGASGPSQLTVGPSQLTGENRPYKQVEGVFHFLIRVCTGQSTCIESDFLEQTFSDV